MAGRFAAVTLSVLVGLVARSAEPATTPRQKPAYYFPTAVGARWVYQERVGGEPGAEWTEVVTGVEEDGADRLVSVGRVGKNGKAIPWEVYRVSDRRLERSDPPLPVLSLLPADADERRDQLRTGKPLSPEARPAVVAVPGGSFRAMCVSKTAPYDPSFLVVPFTETSWYAPDVGLVKRTSRPAAGWQPGGAGGAVVLEVVLKSFTPGKE